MTKEAIECANLEYRETDEFFYILESLGYVRTSMALLSVVMSCTVTNNSDQDEVLSLVESSKALRNAPGKPANQISSERGASQQLESPSTVLGRQSVHSSDAKGLEFQEGQRRDSHEDFPVVEAQSLTPAHSTSYWEQPYGVGDQGQPHDWIFDNFDEFDDAFFLLRGAQHGESNMTSKTAEPSRSFSPDKLRHQWKEWAKRFAKAHKFRSAHGAFSSHISSNPSQAPTEPTSYSGSFSSGQTSVVSKAGRDHSAPNDKKTEWDTETNLQGKEVVRTQEEERFRQKAEDLSRQQDEIQILVEKEERLHLRREEQMRLQGEAEANTSSKRPWPYHQREVKGKLQYWCSLCHAGFETKDGIWRHLKRLHSLPY